MKRLFIALALLALTAPAFAGNDNANPCGNNGNNCQTGGQGGAGGNATATANGGTGLGGNATVGNVTANGGTHIQSNTQTSVNTTVSTQGQAAIAKSEGSSASSGGNSLTVNEAKQKLQAPGMGIGYAAPSAVCALTNGAALSVPGGAGSIGTSKVDKGCERREWVRVLVELGAQDAAARVACSDPVVYEANPADCAAIKQNPAPSAAPAPKAASTPNTNGGRS